MSSKQKSAYDRGFAIRLSILLTVLAVVSFGLYKDRERTRIANLRITELMDALTRFEGGKGLSREEVRTEFGFAPAETNTTGSFEVERFEFKRVLPFSEGQFINVAYFKGRVHEAVVNREFDPNAMNSSLMAGIKTTPKGERTIPVAALGGGSGGGDRDPKATTDLIMRSDLNGDDKLSHEEIPSEQMREQIKLLDDDGDGFLSRKEIEKTIRARINQDEQIIEFGGPPGSQSVKLRQYEYRSEGPESDRGKSNEAGQDASKKGQQEKPDE